MTGWHPVLRPIGRLLVIAQLALALQPLSVLAQEQGTLPFNPVAQAELQRLGKWNQDIEKAKAQRAKEAASPADQVSEHLAQSNELVKNLSRSSSGNRSSQITELKTQLDAVDQGTASVRAEFEAMRAELVRKNLPASIIARHDAEVAQFESRVTTFAGIAKKIKTKPGSEEEGIREMGSFFESYPTTRKPNPLPAGKLPWSNPKPNARPPAVSKTAWFQNLYGDKGVRLAQAGGSIGSLQFTIPPELGKAPTTADLSETDEVQLTPAIRAKAQELGNNPVNIANWVRNTIEYTPTAGAIQSAQDTLDKKRGNATDTASLLIALLRASNIPARYQFGTVDIAADKVQNWVGGANKPEAALQILNQGGIAAMGIASGGRISTIRMEHVWVNAYVNWTPSRGAKDGGANMTPRQHVNPNGNLNAWVPLDGSYKQYSYSAGMDLKAAVPLDANAVINAAQQGATVNAAQGWVQNVNQAAVQSQLDAYQTRLKSYIDSTPTGTNSTVGDVIGKKIIPQTVHTLLAGTLQNAVVVQGQETSAVPANLQHQFTYRLYTSPTEQAMGNAWLSFTEKTSKLVGKRLTLSYVPATQADADTIASYLPKPHADGSPILPSELPTSLPGYLIQLKAQINLDGQVVATSNTSVPMGTDLYSTGGFTQLYDTRQWDLTGEETNVAGQATAIGISAGGISAPQLSQLKDRLTAAQTKLQAKDVTGLTGEQISGDLLTAVIWSWFAAGESHNRLSQNQAGIIENPGLGYGLFHAVVNPQYSWGVIRKVTFPGVNLDVGHVRNLTWSKDNNPQNWVAYNRLRGQYMSALEHAIPERFFNNPNQCNATGTTTPIAGLPTCPQGISAVKALGLAAQAGQKIYTITAQVYQDNPNIVNNQLFAHSQSTKDRIQQALDAGYEITIHEAPITQDGWTGAGFSVIDPNTGAGGYLIEGGSNGSWLALTIAVLFIAFGLYFILLPFFVLFAPFLTPILLTLLGILQLITARLNELGDFRSFLANLAYGEISAGLGVLFTSPVLGIVLFALFAYLNVIYA